MVGLPDLDGYEVARRLRAGMDLHMTQPVDVDVPMEEVRKGRPKPP